MRTLTPTLTLTLTEKLRLEFGEYENPNPNPNPKCGLTLPLTGGGDLLRDLEAAVRGEREEVDETYRLGSARYNRGERCCDGHTQGQGESCGPRQGRRLTDHLLSNVTYCPRAWARRSPRRSGSTWLGLAVRFSFRVKLRVGAKAWAKVRVRVRARVTG